MRKRTNILGHQAPKGWRQTNFNSIELEGVFAYCSSHNFVYNTEEENRKLHYAQPCFYTDRRYTEGRYNFYKSTKLFWQRWTSLSLKSCIRRTNKCHNIPKGTIVRFCTSWFYHGKKIDPSYQFKVKKENEFDPKYEISMDGYSRNFNTCERSKSLTDALRSEGFIVYVNNKNPDFILGMIKTASNLTGKSVELDDELEGEIATAYGFGKRIGYSSNNSDYRGYYDGIENILWDNYTDFNKWSQCNHIKKETSIEEILKILKTPNKSED